MKKLAILPKDNRIACTSIGELTKISPIVVRQVEQRGYCIVRTTDATECSLMELSQYFGKLQSHVRANKYGVVDVASGSVASRQKIDESKYYGATHYAHPVHTDGAYLDGFLIHEGKFKWIGPPALVFLQCVRPATTGGQNIVIDAQRIFSDLILKQPDVARSLMMPGCVSFCRDDQMAARVSVYERLAARRFRIRFRSDNSLYMMSEVFRKAVQHLFDAYISNPEYRNYISLNSGDILVLDNFRMLHGRDAFELDEPGNDRLLRRTWIFDENQTEEPINFLNAKRDCRAFNRLKPYSLVSRKSCDSDLQISLGIHISKDLENILDKNLVSYLPIAS